MHRDLNESGRLSTLGQLEEGQKTTRLLSNGVLVVDGLVNVAPEGQSKLEGQQFTRGVENTNMTDCISSLQKQQ
jgi:hypothetical protein